MKNFKLYIILPFFLLTYFYFDYLEIDKIISLTIMGVSVGLLSYILELEKLRLKYKLAFTILLCMVVFGSGQVLKNSDNNVKSQTTSNGFG
jgi:hypothetical protein